MTTPRHARDALESAVENQRAQRAAAQETKRVQIPAPEEGIETPETDGQE